MGGNWFGEPMPPTIDLDGQSPDEIASDRI